MCCHSMCLLPVGRALISRNCESCCALPNRLLCKDLKITWVSSVMEIGTFTIPEIPAPIIATVVSVRPWLCAMIYSSVIAVCVGEDVSFCMKICKAWTLMARSEIVQHRHSNELLGRLHVSLRVKIRKSRSESASAIMLGYDSENASRGLSGLT